ncbi:MAG: hypothetical protein N2C14_19765 [Planctomycetales bacterium]
MTTWNMNRRQAMALGALAMAGCGPAAMTQQPDCGEHRARFLLDEEPSGAIGVDEAREAAGDLKSGKDLVVLGRIGGGSGSPWSKGRASFLLADPAAAIEVGHDHGDDHDHANCPFCNRKQSKSDPLTIVHFPDDAGKVVAIDARELLGVAAGQLVVVRGRAKIDSLGNLAIKADGLYLRE